METDIYIGFSSALHLQCRLYRSSGALGYCCFYISYIKIVLRSAYVREELKIKLSETALVFKPDSKMSNIKIGFEKI
jgi:hypothetical protein